MQVGPSKIRHSSKFRLLFCRGVTLFEWNFVVPQGGVGQGGGGQVPGLLGDVTSSIKSKICL